MLTQTQQPQTLVVQGTKTADKKREPIRNSLSDWAKAGVEGEAEAICKLGSHDMMLDEQASTSWLANSK